MRIPNSWRKCWQASRGFLKEVIDRFSEDRVALAAGAISFFTTLSLIPLLLLAISIAAYFVTPEQARQFVINLNLEQILGPTISEALQAQVISVVRNKALLTGVALIIGFWTGSQVFVILESAMNLAWHAKRKRPFWMRRGLAILMLIIIGTLMLGSVLLTNLVRLLASLEVPLWGHRVGEIPWLITTLVSFLSPLFLIFTIFTVIYRILPTKKVTLHSVIPGAAVASILWLASVHLFGWYAATFARNNILYTSFGGLGLLMFWFYYSAFILLLGAEISAVYHHRLVEAGDRQERLLEENERVPALAAAASEQAEQRDAAARETVSYYGYQHTD